MFVASHTHNSDGKGLEDAIDDVGTDGSAGAEDSSIAHLLSEFLAMFF